MNAKQIKVFEELLKDENFKGKKELNHILWLNTSTPKYKIGECFKVTDRSRRIYGVQIVNFKAKIIRTFSWRDEERHCYELEMECEVGGKHYATKIARYEDELTERCEDNVNVFDEAKSKHPDQMSI
jgi:hypothetical protein